MRKSTDGGRTWSDMKLVIGHWEPFPVPASSVASESIGDKPTLVIIDPKTKKIIPIEPLQPQG